MFSNINTDLEQLNNNLRKISGPRHPILYAAAEYLFSAGGKRIRPAIILLVAKATNTKEQLYDEHKRLAEITEIIHTASLLHDDVVDNCKTRRGLDTVNQKFNNKVAILAGDFLFAQSSWYLANLNNLSVVKIISKVITDFAEGEIEQGLRNFDPSSSLDTYMNKSFHKTASLLAYSCKAAAILSGADSKVQKHFYNYGKHLGIAFQIIDDILDLEGTEKNIGKPQGLDLKNGNLTAPTMFALDKCPELKEMIQREFTEKNDIQLATQIITRTNAIKQAKDLAKEHAQASLEYLHSYPKSQSIENLKLFSYNIINRIS
uniref:Prenyl transferase n=1 Tax=Neogoniolithon spectabile TaxID=231755 RepID=A0A3G3MGU1_9FLOR|nr:prenyl transferase [Neogoniolithon spectabile]AYR06058.1 prenyl transferase [Neogoniolithon spectabile]